MTLATLTLFDTRTDGGRAGFDQAVKATSQADLNREVLASLDAKNVPADALTTLLDKALDSRDARVKGRVFVAAGRAVLALHERAKHAKRWFSAPSDDPRQLAVWLSRMTAILQSDPRGVVHQLPLLDGYGLGLTAFSLQSLRTQGAIATRALGTLLAQMQGAGATEDPIAYFEHTTPGFFGSKVYQNATCLGYVVGALRQALIQLNAPLADTRAMVTALAAAADQAWAGHATSSFAPVRLGDLSDLGKLKDIVDVLYLRARPIDGQGNFYVGRGASSCESMYLRVQSGWQ